MLGNAVRLEAINIRADCGEAEVLEKEFLVSGTDFAGGAGSGAAGGRIESATDIAGRARVEGLGTSGGAVGAAVGRARGWVVGMEAGG